MRQSSSRRRFSRGLFKLDPVLHTRFVARFSAGRQVNAATQKAYLYARTFLESDEPGVKIDTRILRTVFSKPIGREFLINPKSSEGELVVAVLQHALRQRGESPAHTTMRVKHFITNFRNMYFMLMTGKTPPKGA